MGIPGAVIIDVTPGFAVQRQSYVRVPPGPQVGRQRAPGTRPFQSQFGALLQRWPRVTRMPFTPARLLSHIEKEDRTWLPIDFGSWT